VAPGARGQRRPRARGGRRGRTRDDAGDPDPKVRYLGATGLAHGLGTPSQKDPGLAKRIVAAARKETEPTLAASFGDAVARIDFAATGTVDDVKAIIHAHPLLNLRLRIIDQMMIENIGNDAVFDMPRELLKDDDPKIRLAAIDAYVHDQGAMRRLADICKLMLDNIENPDQLVAASAGGNLTRIGNKGCPGAYDTLLASLDKRVKGKTLGDFDDFDDFAMSPGRVCEDKTATPAHKTHAIAVLKAMSALDPTKMHQVRFFALDSMLTCDPDGGKKWLAGFASDKDERVKKHAADLLARQKP
jgi:hypothetical protein